MINRPVEATDVSGEVARYQDAQYSITDAEYSAEIYQAASTTLTISKPLGEDDKVQTYACNGDSINECFITEFSATEVKYFLAEEPAAGFDANQDLLEQVTGV